MNFTTWGKQKQKELRLVYTKITNREVINKINKKTNIRARIKYYFYVFHLHILYIVIKFDHTAVYFLKPIFYNIGITFYCTIS